MREGRGWQVWLKSYGHSNGDDHQDYRDQRGHPLASLLESKRMSIKSRISTDEGNIKREGGKTCKLQILEKDIPET